MRVSPDCPLPARVAVFFRNFGDFSDGLHQLLGRRRNFLGGGSDLRRRRGNFAGSAELLLGGRRDLGGGGIDL